MINRLILLSILGVYLSDVLSAQTTFSKTYNDTMNLSAAFSRPVEDSSGVYVLATVGTGLSPEAGGYQLILKVNASGEILLRKFSYTMERLYYGFSQLIKLKSNNYVISSGRTALSDYGSSQLYVQKFTSDFSDTLWSYFHHDSLEFDISKDLIELSDGSIIVTGYRDYSTLNQANSMDAFLLKLSAKGIKEFFYIYDQGRGDAVNNFVLTADKGLLIGGSSTSPNNPERAYVVKIDSTGNQQWVKYYPQMTSAYISRYSDNKYILSGYIVGPNKPKILFIDSAGEVIKNNTYTYIQRAFNYLGRKVFDNGIVCIGITTNDEESNAGYILKTDDDGNLLWQRRYNHGPGVDYFIDFIETQDHHLLISGAADDGSCCGGQNAWLVKLDSMGCLEPGCWEVGIEDAKANELGVKVFPNPASEWLNFKLPGNSGEIRLEVFSISGKRVMNTTLFAPLEAVQVSHLPAGLYLLKLTNKNGTSSAQRIIIAR